MLGQGGVLPEQVASLLQGLFVIVFFYFLYLIHYLCQLDIYKPKGCIKMHKLRIILSSSHYVWGKLSSFFNLTWSAKLEKQ